MSDIVETIIGLVIIWFLSLAVLNIQISLNIERVPPSTSIDQAISDAWDKSTHIKDREVYTITNETDTEE